MSGEAVKVIVRCRPLNTREKDLNCNNVLNMDSARGQCSIINPSDLKAPPKNFFFDGSYFTDSTTEQIYADIAFPLVEGVTQGYNGTIFAYGQTGCGKSFTMQGILDPATQRGIIPRAFDHIFETIAISEQCKYLVHASYLEIYNEDIRDLLGKDVKAKLELKEHPDKGVYVAGLSMHKVSNVRDCQVVMDRGWKNRSTGATLMNADSSRSHSIFSIYLEMADNEVDDDGDNHIRAGKLNLVDLAGSERQSKTGATGDRLKEATKINLSLSALGNVISALVDGKSKHIPYRDSKLTRLLQDSLGGNTKTLMIACLSPADNNYEETLSTLRYANRAKNIQNKPKINEDPKDALLRQYQEEINRLKQMLMGQLPMDMSNLAMMGGSGGGDAMTTNNQQPTIPMIQIQTTNNKMNSDELNYQRKAIEAEKEKLRQEYELRLQEKEHLYQTEAADKAKLLQDMNKLRKYYDNKIESLDVRYRDIQRSDQALHGNAAAGVPETSSRSQKGAAGKSKQLAEIVPRGGGGNYPLNVATADITASATVLIVNPDGSAVDVDQESSSFGGGDGGGGEGHGEQQARRAPTATKSGQRAVHVNSKKSVGNEPNQSQQLTPDQLLAKLRQLEQGMVGGEQSMNRDMKEKHRRRNRHVERRMKLLRDANKEEDIDDEEVMRGIFENIHDELRAKNKMLKKEMEKNDSLKQEIDDLQIEFERDRTDYLDTIREQEKRLKLFQCIVERMVNGVRRDCNYTNIDRIISQSRWNSEKEEWQVPQLTVERTQLPTTLGNGPVGGGGGGGPTYARQLSPASGGSSAGGGGRRGMWKDDDDMDDDRSGHNLYNKMTSKPDASQEYFTNKRAAKLLQGRGQMADPTSPSRSLMAQQPPPPDHHSEYSRGGYYDPPTSPVHNGGNMDDYGRKPSRLHAMDGGGGGMLQSAGRRGRKKRANLQDDDDY